jgi:hypothetical protein
MTQTEIDKFFNEAKGKKIRFSSWPLGQYYIPRSITGKLMRGLEVINENENNHDYIVCEGWLPSERHRNNHWEMDIGNTKLGQMYHGI